MGQGDRQNQTPQQSHQKLKKDGGIENKLLSYIRNTYTLQNQIMEGEFNGNTYK